MICFILLAVGCEKKSGPSFGMNRVTEVKFEQGKEGWMKLKIYMELDPSNPIYPIGAKDSLKSEKLKLHLTKTEKEEDSYYAEFRYFPPEAEELNKIHMEDFIWHPSIGFDTIKLESTERQSQLSTPFALPPSLFELRRTGRATGAIVLYDLQKK